MKAVTSNEENMDNKDHTNLLLKGVFLVSLNTEYYRDVIQESLHDSKMRLELLYDYVNWT